MRRRAQREDNKRVDERQQIACQIGTERQNFSFTILYALSTMLTLNDRHHGKVSSH